MESEVKHKIPDFIQIKSDCIQYGWCTYCREEGNMWVGYIPAYDICFSVPEKDKIHEMSRAMVRTFIVYWAKEKGFRRFILQINKLKFRAMNGQHDIAMKDMLNGKFHPAKFKPTKIYDIPVGAESVEQEEAVMM